MWLLLECGMRIPAAPESMEQSEEKTKWGQRGVRIGLREALSGWAGAQRCRWSERTQGDRQKKKAFEVAGSKA